VIRISSNTGLLIDFDRPINQAVQRQEKGATVHTSIILTNITSRREARFWCFCSGLIVKADNVFRSLTIKSSMTYFKQHTLVSILIGMSASIFWCFQRTQANVNTHKPEKVKVSLSDSEKSGADTLQESFDAFLYHFSTDSLFQIAHICFPLQGIVVDDISGEEKKDMAC